VVRRIGGTLAAFLVGGGVAVLLLTPAWWLTFALVDKYVQEGCFLDCGDVWTVRGIALVYTAIALVTLGAIAFIVHRFARRSAWRRQYVVIALVPALMLAGLGYVTLSDISFETTLLAFPPLSRCVLLYGEEECRHEVFRSTVPELERRSCDELSSLRPLTDHQETIVYFTNETDDVLTIEWIGYETRQATAQLEPGAAFSQQTYATHPWLVSSEGGCRAIFIAEAGGGHAPVR
jgi:hypothetical protein